MRRIVLLAALTLGMFAAAPLQAQERVAAPKPAATHYRTLEKMLRRFSRQAGSASTAKVFAAR